MKKLGITKKGFILTTAGIITAIGVGTYSVIAIDAWFDTHDLKFQAPVVFQQPVKIEKRKATIISPVSLIHKAQAEEIQNPYNSKSPKGIAWEINKKEFGIQHWEAFETLITNESGWNPFSKNPSSGACGLGQALPCSKMKCENWDYECQVKWVADYIKNRYKTPSKALNHWLSRVPINGVDHGHWY